MFICDTQLYRPACSDCSAEPAAAGIACHFAAAAVYVAAAPVRTGAANAGPAVTAAVHCYPGVISTTVSSRSTTLTKPQQPPQQLLSSQPV